MLWMTELTALSHLHAYTVTDAVYTRCHFSSLSSPKKEELQRLS